MINVVTILHVITGLVPVISIREARRFSNRDGRHKAGHDVVDTISGWERYDDPNKLVIGHDAFSLSERPTWLQHRAQHRSPRCIPS